MNSTTKIYDTSTCMICYDDYQTTKSNDCLLLKCGHIFHESCVKTWIHQQKNCPLCKNKTFVPLTFKDIAKRTANDGIQGAKLILPLLIITIVIMMIANTCLKILLAMAKIDVSVNEHQFDLTKPKDLLISIGLYTILWLGTNSIYEMIISMKKSLNDLKKQPTEVAKKISYTPLT